jgi:hypothetical protein
MVKAVDNIGWETAILEVIQNLGGSATLKELYQGVPKIKSIPLQAETNHIIRAYLRRMTRISHKLKKIGIGTYALPSFELKGSEKIKEEITTSSAATLINKPYLHSHIEGMLLELGNIYGYLTYTADPSGIFNGKALDKFTTLDIIPAFTSPGLLNIISKIDVVWFRKRALVTIPKHTFDVELTTDFSKALHRAYQLRDFKTSFYLVSPAEKNSQFEKKLNTDPFTEISNRYFFRSTEEIFSLHEAAVKHFSLLEKIIVEQT